MLYTQPYEPHRRAVVVIPDADAKRILSYSRIMLNDGPYLVEGRVIGWKRTDAGPLGAVVANPVTGARSLWGVDFATRRPRPLKRLA